MQGRGEAGGTAADDEDIVTITPSHLSLRREKRASITSASSAEYAAQSDPDIRVIDADGSDPAPQNNSSGAIFDTDQELVRRVQKGDKRAFDLLVRRYQHKIHGLVSRFIRSPDEIDDVVQESFIKAYRALPRFRGDSAFYTWVYRIAINTAKNHLVARSRRPPDVDVEVSDAEFIESADHLRDSESPESALARDQLERTIDDAIRALPEDLRSAVTLREFDGLSYEQIAAIMECPVGTVRSRIFRAREAIDKRIKPLLSRR
jgi:RNA polymerase sigma-70 factor (ECF subfamily)